MTRAESYVQDWLALVELANSKPPPADFKDRHDVLAAAYKRLDVAEQGEVSHLLDMRK